MLLVFLHPVLTVSLELTIILVAVLVGAALLLPPLQVLLPPAPAQAAALPGLH